MPQITILYAGLLGFVALYLSILCGKERGRAGVSLGDGGDERLIVAMRRHANFVEFVPLSLILIALLELNGVAGIAIHCFGAALVFFRVAHAQGMQVGIARTPGRFVGAAGNFLLLIVLSAWAIATCFM